MKLTYKQRLFVYFLILFGLFTGSIIFFEGLKNKRYRTEALEDKLDAFASIIYNDIIAKNGDSSKIEVDTATLELFPFNFRVSVITTEGKVIFDNTTDNISDDHSQREEILKAKEKGTGSYIRVSTSNDEEYIYYAKRYPRFYIRVALPFDWQVKESLHADNLFIPIIIIISFFVLILAYLMANRFGQSINKLKDFALNPSDNLLKDTNIEFPDDELGEVAKRLIQNYKELNQNRQKTALEREKLLQHVHSSDEGICFFNSNRGVEFYNGLFIYHLNTIVDYKNNNPCIIFNEEAFKVLTDFLNTATKETFFETEIQTQSQYFLARVNIFEDRSFEVILINTTKLVKTRLLKQEMTSNIAHELRTPITSIRGYLETIVGSTLSTEQINYFIDKAYKQTLNLNELIEDMSVITKIDEAVQSFETEPINIKSIIDDVLLKFEDILVSNDIEIVSNIDENCSIKGNKSLLYIIFKNLIENSIKHGGTKAHIHIECYNEDSNFYYFSYYDEGVGISNEQHLNRIFERFYRIAEGRTRKTGGTGLGLAIVKNAILVHKGTITARKRKDGKLEFLFKLKKS